MGKELRVHSDDTELIEGVRHYQGNPFTGVFIGVIQMVI